MTEIEQEEIHEVYDIDNKLIKVGDYVLYSINFTFPIVGKVTKIYKNSFKYNYSNKYPRWGNMEWTQVSSICKCPEFCKVITKYMCKEIREIFEVTE